MQCDWRIEAVIGGEIIIIYYLVSSIYYSLRSFQPAPLCGSMIGPFAGGQVAQGEVNGAAGQVGTSGVCYQSSEGFKSKRRA